MIRLPWHHALIASATFLMLSEIPASAQDVPDSKSTPEGALTTTPDRKTRSEAKDAEANRHTAKPVDDAAEPDHIRGQIIKVESSSIVVTTRDGKSVHLGLANDITIIGLTKASFTEVDFGSYVGAVAIRLDEYSPIIRDSAVWLHKGFELRLIDEKLRGIALGEKKWDLVPGSIMSHGWVDDMEIRVLSIKWGPTDYDETDVEVPRDVPVLRMSLADKNMIKPGVHIFAGAQKGSDGQYLAVFLLIGKDGIVPPL